MAGYFQNGEKRGATTIEVDISGSNVECITEFRLKDFKLGRDDLIPYNLEKTFKSTRNLRYHFEEAKNQKHKDKLFVVFLLWHRNISLLSTI